MLPQAVFFVFNLKFLMHKQKTRLVAHGHYCDQRLGGFPVYEYSYFSGRNNRPLGFFESISSFSMSGNRLYDISFKQIRYEARCS